MIKQDSANLEFNISNHKNTLHNTQIINMAYTYNFKNVVIIAQPNLAQKDNNVQYYITNKINK